MTYPRRLNSPVNSLELFAKLFNHAALLSYMQANPAASVNPQGIKKKIEKKGFLWYWWVKRFYGISRKNEWY